MDHIQPTEAAKVALKIRTVANGGAPQLEEDFALYLDHHVVPFIKRLSQLPVPQRRATLSVAMDIWLRPLSHMHSVMDILLNEPGIGWPHEELDQ